MSYGIICRQKDCRAYANYRYTWPGRDESYVCEPHAAKVRAVAGAIGMHLQLIPLGDADHRGPAGMASLEDQGKE